MHLHHLVFLLQLPLRSIIENNLVFVHLRSLMYAWGTRLRLWQLCGCMIKPFVPKHMWAYKTNKGIAVLILAIGTRTNPVDFTLRPCYFLDPLSGRLGLPHIKCACFEKETNLLSLLGLGSWIVHLVAWEVKSLCPLCGNMGPYRKSIYLRFCV